MYFRIYDFVPYCLICKVIVYSAVFIFLEQSVNGVNVIYILTALSTYAYKHM